jgi:hypothetical protein
VVDLIAGDGRLQLPGGRSEFNAGGSANPPGFHFGNFTDYDDDQGMRDFFSLAPPGSGSGLYQQYGSPPPGSGGYNPYASAPHPHSSSTPSHLGLSGLNINASAGYPHLNEYEGILRSGDQQGGASSRRGTPPIGVPSGSVGVDAAPLPRQRRRPSRARGARSGATGAAQAAANMNPPDPVQFASRYSLASFIFCCSTISCRIAYFWWHDEATYGGRSKCVH